MIILGLNTFHADAAACLVRDGRVQAAVAEERLGRRQKHFAGFPAEAIKHVLRAGEITARDIDVVAVGHDPRANLVAKTAYSLRNPVRAAKSARNMVSRERQIDSLHDRIANVCDVLSNECRFRIAHIEHHRAHLASSFWSSGYESAAGFSYDASGDFTSAAYARCDRDIDIISREFLPHSLGYFYSALCQYIGFDGFSEEYKVMGLSAYGTPRYMHIMERMLRYTGQGHYRASSEYLSGVVHQSQEELLDESGCIVTPRLYTSQLVDDLGPARRRDEPLTALHRDIAASCQLHFENVVVQCAQWLHTVIPVDDFVIAGGCALNGLCNARLMRDTPFKRMYVPSGAGDDGSAVGAALEAWRQEGGTFRGSVSEAYWGPSYNENAMADAIASANLIDRCVTVSKLDERAMIDGAVDELANGAVVAWFHGAGEWGARALGNRSILAHPGLRGIKDHINHTIKRREAFRPFAPSVLQHRVSEYFEQDVDSPFMTFVVRVREEKREELSGVCHADHTARLHSVTREQNPLFFDLISAFERRTGIPALLNTSFNDNEPIVDTPSQAISCFLRTNIPVLCMGPFFLRKQARSA